MEWRGFPQPGTINFGRTADDYDKHRPGFPDSFFDRIFAEDLVRPGQRAIDLGTGTGTMALGLAARGVTVSALDPAEELLEVLARRAEDASLDIKLKKAVAEDTGEPDAAYDVVTAAQCWWWFDPVRATREIRRILVPKGRLIIASFCYLPLPGSMAYETEELILEHNPSWSAAACQGIFPEQPTQLATGGFKELTTFSYDVDVEFTHERWRGRIRACNGVAASLSPAEVDRFDRALAERLKSRWPEPLQVLHRVFVVTGLAPASPG